MAVSTDNASRRELLEAAAAEIERLAQADVDEELFFSGFLQQLHAALSADAAAIWLLNDNGLVNRVCETGFNELQLDQNRLASRLNIQYMLDAIQNGEPKVHEFREASGESPIDRPLLAVPIRHNDSVVGVAELFLPAGSRPEDRLEQLQFVEEMCHFAGRFLAWRRKLASPQDQVEFWQRFEWFQSSLYQSLDSSRIAATAVNDARQLLGCDRVSIAMQHGARTRIVAVSGQESVSQRSNAIAALTTLAAEVIAGGEPVSYSGNPGDAPPHLAAQLQDHTAQSKSRTVKIVPLRKSSQDLQNEPGTEQSRAFGALIVEQFSADWLTPLTSARTELVAGHLATALQNARSHEEVFLLPLRRQLGRCLGYFQGRRLAITGVVVACLTAAVVALCLVPATYRVAGDGKLMPVVQRRVFAPWDGEVIAVHVTGGQQVEEGQMLVELRNDEIAAQHVAVRNQLETRSQKLRALEAALDSTVRTASRKEVIELQGRIAQTRVEVDGLRKRDEILRRQVEQQTIRAPISGVVAAFQIEQLLRDRPVRRGDTLLEVMDTSGPWQLELEIPEHRLEYLTQGRPPETVGDLPVEFALATNPEDRYAGRVAGLASRTSLSADSGTVVDVRVAVDRERIPNRRIGAVVQAKVDCGTTSLAWVLFGDVVEFAQRRLW